MSAEGRVPLTVGLVGLGAMGRPVGERLLRAGFVVIGHDVDPGRRADFAQSGGSAVGSVGEVARSASTIITLLPSAAALASVADDLAAAGTPGAGTSLPDLVELSTLGLAAKESARSVLAARGASMLDGAVSGTAVQASSGDLVLYSSGDAAVHWRCEPILRAIGRSVHYLGEFGRATQTKLVANHLVAVHVAAAAEALLLARRSGLDLDTTIEVVGDGAGTSRMFELRGPMMAAEVYEPPSMRMELFLKDLDLIESLCREVATPTPLFDAATALYRAAVAEGYGSKDTAAVSAWLAARPGPDVEGAAPGPVQDREATR